MFRASLVGGGLYMKGSLSGASSEPLPPSPMLISGDGSGHVSHRGLLPSTHNFVQNF